LKETRRSIHSNVHETKKYYVHVILTNHITAKPINIRAFTPTNQSLNPDLEREGPSSPSASRSTHRLVGRTGVSGGASEESSLIPFCGSLSPEVARGILSSARWLFDVEPEAALLWGATLGSVLG
jgi:hypothetical protein